MSTNSNENKNVFPLYPYLPQELKIMIVDEMDCKDRCLFGACSRLSLKEAKLSKNAIYGLELGWFAEKAISIHIWFSVDAYFDGFTLVFKEDENGEHSMDYCTFQNGEWEKEWKIDLDNSIDVVEPAIAHFKHLLKMYQNTIKCLQIRKYAAEIEDIDFGIDSLKKLEHLSVHSEIDIIQFLPKLRRRLDGLNVEGIENCRIIEEWEQTYDVQNYLSLRDSNLNYQQFLRLSSKHVNMPIGQLTEQDIFHFLKSWHNGTYTGRIEYFNLTLGTSNYKQFFEIVRRLVKELDGTAEEEYGIISIKQKDSEELAKLSFVGAELRFITQRYEDEEVYDSDDEEEDEDEDMDSEDQEEVEYEVIDESDNEIEVITIDDSEEDDDVICLN